MKKCRKNKEKAIYLSLITKVILIHLSEIVKIQSFSVIKKPFLELFLHEITATPAFITQTDVVYIFGSG